MRVCSLRLLIHIYLNQLLLHVFFGAKVKVRCIRERHRICSPRSPNVSIMEQDYWLVIPRVSLSEIDVELVLDLRPLREFLGVDFVVALALVVE